MTQTETWTIGKLLEWTTQYLRNYGSDSPRLDAEVLLAHARNCQRIQLYTSFDEEPNDVVKTAFREMVRRRAEGSPVAYLVGHKEFYSLNFRVTPDTLIPRSETEDLVVVALDRAKQLLKQTGSPNRTVQIADVCTGSGCIAISMAKHLPSAHFVATDISHEALAIAKANSQTHQVDDRVEFLQSDLLDTVSSRTFDLIVSNPPYVSEAEYEALPKSVREYEPKQALLAGPTGMEIIIRLIDQATRQLSPDGWLIFEISPMLSQKVSDHLQSRTEWKLDGIAKDIAGHQRIVIAKKS